MRSELAVTWPDNDLLPALRAALGNADEALLCVAFANRRGVGLLEPQLSTLGGRCRLLVTSVFGGTTEAALVAAAGLQVRVRVLNPAVGTFHPKLYLTRTDRSAAAVVGSANLTSGLVANIETAMVVTGTPADQPLAACWQLAERLWAHPAAVDWSPTAAPVQDEQFEPDLFDRLRQAVRAGTVVSTLTQRRPNTVAETTPYGIYLETERSRSRGSGPQLVPAWMIQLAWDYLQRHRQLSNRFLVATDGLNVKRSSAVCALLAQLPEVKVASTHPLMLRLRD